MLIALVPFIFITFLFGCGSSDSQTVVMPSPAVAQSPTARVLPTLYPTSTQEPLLEPTQMQPPKPTEITNTPIPFEEVVVSLRYSIPGIGLDRRLVGRLSSHIEVMDETTGSTVVRYNQPGVLLELQQALPEVTLRQVPPGCDLCVRLAFELPASDRSGSGWLTDVQLLASLENYTSAALGPHFPPGTLVGLRRSATVYQVGHTVALTDDGLLWRWTAVEGQLEGPQSVVDQAAALRAIVGEIDLETIPDQISATCPYGPGFETLYINKSGEVHTVSLSCPELALPADLLPIYLPIDFIAAEKLGAQDLEKPEPPLPINGLLYYSRGDGAQLTLLQNGPGIVTDINGESYTTTITNSMTLSLTSQLISTKALNIGTALLEAGEVANILVVRGASGVYEAGWQVAPEPSLEALVKKLDEILDQIIVPLIETRGAGPVPVPEATLTPES